MDIKKIAQNVLRNYIAALPEVQHNAYGYFNYDNRVVEESVNRGDPKIPYYTAKDFTNEAYNLLVTSAMSMINPILANYSPRVACEDALNMAIRSVGNGFFDGKINANAFNVLIGSMLSPQTLYAKKKKDEDIELKPHMLKRLDIKKKDIPRPTAPRRKDVTLVREKGKVKIRKGR